MVVKPAADAASPSTRRGRAREAAADGPREQVVQDRDVRRRRQAEREGGHQGGAAVTPSRPSFFCTGTTLRKLAPVRADVITHANASTPPRKGGPRGLKNRDEQQPNNHRMSGTMYSAMYLTIPSMSQTCNFLQAIHGTDRTTHEPPPTSPGRARHKPIAALPCGGRARPAPHTGPAPRTKPNAAPLQGRGARPAPLTGAGTMNTRNRAPRGRQPNTTQRGERVPKSPRGLGVRGVEGARVSI